MKKPVFINGFSRMDKKQRLESIVSVEDMKRIKELFRSFEVDDSSVQSAFESFSENTVSNFHLPYGIAPNFIIDGDLFHIPMAVEESSVVAAASRSAKFWYDKGGFQTVFLKTIKTGQIHFSFDGDIKLLQDNLDAIRDTLNKSVKHLISRMEERGGGLRDIELLDKRQHVKDYYQFLITFETADSMGANFINSCLETMADALMVFMNEHSSFKNHSYEVIMAILSNYTPESIIRMRLETTVDKLDSISPGIDGRYFANKFCKAVDIARTDVFRATTHNKGIMNGVDAAVIATGNDFRAVEAAAHAYAARNGRYSSLSECTVEGDVFRYELELPLSVGTVGGLTSLHPLAAFSIQFLGEPSAEQLMKIIAAAGLANNFGAVRSLVTEGIQKGHMKLHLDNILLKYDATDKERMLAQKYFEDKKVSYTDVKAFLDDQRN